jgi:hypothetical protein
MVNAPSIEITETEDSRITLPPISSATGLKADLPSQQRRESTGEIFVEAQNRRSLTPTPLTPRKAASRSAPSSPIFARRGIDIPGAQLSSPRSVPRKKASKEMRELTDILGILDDVKLKNVPDLDSMKIRDSRCASKKTSIQLENTPMTVENSKDVFYNADEGRNGQPLEESKMTTDPPEVDDDLATSMDKLKFCKYLRGKDIELEDGGKLPEKLIPRSLIIGHTKITM